MAEYVYKQKERTEDEVEEIAASVEDESRKLFDKLSQPGGSIWTRPAIHENLAIFGSNDGCIYALDKKTGELRWKFLTAGVVMSSPVISGSILYVGSIDGKLYALDARTGVKIWDFLTGGRVLGTAAVTDGSIYFGSEDGKVYCLGKDGKKIWDFLTGGPVMTTPAVVNGRVYASSCDKRVYCIENGSKAWSFLTGGMAGSCTIVDIATDETIAGFGVQKESSAFVGKEENLRVCFGSFDGYFYCTDINGRLLWKFQADDGVGVMRGYTHVEGLVYFGAQKFFAVDVRSGRKAWDFQGADRCGDVPPPYHNGTIFVGCYDGNMYALNAKTGKKIFAFRTGGPTISPPVIDNDVLYFGSTDTYLYALDLSKGKAIWTFKTGAAPAAIAWRGWIKSNSPLQRLKRWWKAEVKPNDAYEKQEKKVEWERGYGTDNNPYKLERKDVAYFGNRDYKKIDLDEERRKKDREIKW